MSPTYNPFYYDPRGFLSSATDRNGNTTAYDNNPWTGNVTKVTYADDSTSETIYSDDHRCSDGNNNDSDNPYYPCSYASKKKKYSSKYVRDSSKRVLTIYYPDASSSEKEQFTYDDTVGHGQIKTHRLKTGGVESFVYFQDGRGLLKEYYDADHRLSTSEPDDPEVSPTPSFTEPSLVYTYYGAADGYQMDRVKSITDAAGAEHTTTFTYDQRGQILTIQKPGAAAVVNTYNPDGTLASTKDELGNTITYAYDDYKRLVATTLPPPQSGASPTTTVVSYAWPGGTIFSSYTHTDANPTQVVSAAGKTVRTTYDENFLPLSVTTGYGSSAAATTSFTYDDNGNRKTATDPNGSKMLYYYDERNHLSDMDDPLLNDPNTPHKNSQGHTVSWTYDGSDNVLSVERANGQFISNDYDSRGRFHLTTVHQDPDPDATTTYGYYDDSGLLKTMEDPRHKVYTYSYDLMGRKKQLTYPGTGQGGGKFEKWEYDTVGRLSKFTNRHGDTQNFNLPDSYDSRNRLLHFSWTVNYPTEQTPDVHFVYDGASRLLSINNGNALVEREYFDNNTLMREKTTVPGQPARTVDYTYNVDLTPAAITYPDQTSVGFHYTGRNQIESILNSQGNPIASYAYDLDENLTGRSLENGTASSFVYDELSRVTHIEHAFTDATNPVRKIDYGYDKVNNRAWTKRDNGSGNVAGDQFRYDLADQVIDTKLNIASPDATPSWSPTPRIAYDANGNRLTFKPFGVIEQYTGNNDLNQYHETPQERSEFYPRFASPPR